MRWIGMLLTFTLAVAVVAQEAESPEELAKKLGHDDYEVREAATRKLIEMGEKAVPALEEALKSPDLEARLRAGRALRAIRGSGEGAAGEDEQPDDVQRDDAQPTPGTPGAPGTPGTPGMETRIRTGGIEIQIRNGEVTVRRTVEENGEKKVVEYKGKSLDEIKKEHPELQEALGNLRFGFSQQSDPFRFDMDQWWKNFHDDDFFRRAQEDMRRRMDELERWRRGLQEQRNDWPQWFRDPLERSVDVGSALGIRVTEPDQVLDAQLDLRGHGLVVESVEKDSLADRLGLQRYDILLRLNGAETSQPGDVRLVLQNYKEGDPVTARVVRRGKAVELSTATK